MNAPMNLTPQRGPSVWEKPAYTTNPARLGTIAAGAALVGLGWPLGSTRARIVTGAGLLLMALGLSGKLAGASPFRTAKDWLSRDRQGEADLDDALDASFPASDPPAV